MMAFKDFHQRFRVDESLSETIGINPYYIPISPGLDDKIMINGRQVINLASNNYLGLASDVRVKKAAAAAVYEYGVSLCATPISTGYIDLFQRLEHKLSNFLGLEETMILPSCYQANNGLFPSIAKKEDLIVVDRFAHSSLIQGIKAAGCKIRPFLHNDIDHLQSILKRSAQYDQIFVVTESVFSTDGSIAPFKEMLALCDIYNALPVIDDSHGIGVLGESGKGILEEQNITSYKGIYTASLGKAFANAGGIISGDGKIINYLKYYCPHLVYSTALPPPVLAGIEAVLDIVYKEFSLLKQKMRYYQQVIFDSLRKAGFETVRSEAPINTIKAGCKESTAAIFKRLFENGILTTPFIEPSVPIGEGRVRLIAGANLSKDTVEEAGAIIKRCAL
ncbi:pyridoxal phosphate-dependent aminotransferase family protein [Petroclostridium sp. X23]|uniref:aminotransferase class I/II-fold pyridoxal phosphate-dependent enzyme n=1 Tax=Petroclostridium sp. X23 TaxID=3045146 RepID=UPI0024ACC2F3|nr:pyridoxal phosphate-dependent aminotransferase family protein [Petroclostridium sp. X23]WHH59474.1 pyridoxal phosphate-dependent aminotransferase family protein [Petroclostridium sp. X23]